MSFYKTHQPEKAGSCVVCQTGTDTALAFAGPPEWCAAGLMVLGVPKAEAITLAEAAPGTDTYAEMGVRVCTACVSRCAAGFPPPVLALPGVELPTIRPTR